MEAVIVEIRAAEGGDDAKGLVYEQFAVYAVLAARLGLNLTLLDDRPGLLTFRAEGPVGCFEHEAGGHRWQRIPPTERRGRVHTSTVTVAVLPEPSETELPELPAAELEWSTCRGSGAGGQKRNKTETTVVLRHRPSGVSVRCEDSRDQRTNRRLALRYLRARLWEDRRKAEATARAKDRKAQVGVGARGDKRRTIRTQDGTVTDHVLGLRWRLRDYLRGEWSTQRRKEK
jgi:peptide chain release factor 1